MQSEKAPAIRNKVDMLDAGQIRILKKRLGISEEDLIRIVEKVGRLLLRLLAKKSNSKKLQRPKLLLKFKVRLRD